MSHMKEDFYKIWAYQKVRQQMKLKRLYRKKAIEFHPDKNPGDKEAEANFKKAAEAYEILSDPQKKSQYDQFGHSAFESGGFGGGGMNMEDIFSQFGDIFGVLLEVVALVVLANHSINQRREPQNQSTVE